MHFMKFSITVIFKSNNETKTYTYSVSTLRYIEISIVSVYVLYNN